MDITALLASTKGYGLPVTASIVFHLFILGLMAANWQDTAEIKKVDMPNFVKAELVTVLPKPKADKPRPKPKAKSKPAPKPKPKPTPKPKLKATPVTKVDNEAEKQKQEELARKREEEDRRRQEEEKRRQEEELLLAMIEEEEYQQELADNELAMSYASLIKERVEQNWSRPPSAKYGMEVVLEIHLVPTGHVVGVNVLVGSGNAAFDLSAQQAVRKVERFVEIKDMPSRIFETQFRRFKLLFRPEDKLS